MITSDLHFFLALYRKNIAPNHKLSTLLYKLLCELLTEMRVDMNSYKVFMQDLLKIIAVLLFKRKRIALTYNLFNECAYTQTKK